MGGVDSVIPVDVYVPGCAARPEAIIDGVVAGAEEIRTESGRGGPGRAGGGRSHPLMEATGSS